MLSWRCSPSSGEDGDNTARGENARVTEARRPGASFALGQRARGKTNSRSSSSCRGREGVDWEGHARPGMRMCEQEERKGVEGVRE